MGIIAFAASFGHDSQMLVKGAAFLLVVEDILVDSLMANGKVTV
jgi:hypothetical protein